MVDLLYFTGNLGKWDILKNHLKTNPINLIAPEEGVDTLVDEGANCLHNAIKKAVKGSILFSDMLVIGNDDCLHFEGFESYSQPFSNIYRGIPGIYSGSDLIDFYVRKMKEQKLEKTIATIDSFFSMAINGIALNSIQISYSFEFKVPPNNYHDRGMPLSSFHYFPDRLKYYPELSHEEKLEYINDRLDGLYDFIMNCDIQNEIS